MKDKILVSICVPTFGHGEFLTSCLQSVIRQQTHFKFELLVGLEYDDTDSQDFIPTAAENHNLEIRVIRNRKEGLINIKGVRTGRGNTINLLNKAKGKYIAMCDGDDYWVDELKLQKQFEFMEENKHCSLCHHGQLKLIGERLFDDERFGQISNLSINSASDLFSFQIQPQSRTMFFRNCLTNEDLNGKFILNAIYGDFALCFLLAKYGQIGFLKEDMAVYRVHDQGYAARSLKGNIDYFNSRLRLVEMWCKAKGFLKCDNRSFKTGIMKLYNNAIKRVGRKNSALIVIKHWSKMSINLRTYIDILIALLGSLLFPSNLQK